MNESRIATTKLFNSIYDDSLHLLVKPGSTAARKSCFVGFRLPDDGYGPGGVRAHLLFIINLVRQSDNNSLMLGLVTAN